MSYMPDRQIITILGQNDRYQIDPETGVITDMMSQKQAEDGSAYFTRQANIRDVRSLEYNVIAEEAPGNMSKRMMELQALLEMQERLPVPPEQIIDKMELSATEKERWLEFIKQSQEQEAQKQEKLENLEIQFKNREISDDEQSTANDFLLGMAKIKQAAEKDEKAMKTKYALMAQDEKKQALEFAAQIFEAELAERAARQEMEFDKKKAIQDIVQDGLAHTQDIVQTADKHDQSMGQNSSKHDQSIKFIEEKNAVLLKAAKAKAAQDIATAEAKAEQDIKMAKQKAAQQKLQGGNDSGKGKQTNDAKS